MAVTTGEEVKVLGFWPSPFVLRVRLALNLKGVKYEYIEEQMPGNKSQLLLDSNPVYKKVPVLIHNGKCISESMNIVQYIDEAWKMEPYILPSDPYERSVARFWAAYIDDKLTIAIRILRGLSRETKEEGVKIATTLLDLLDEAFEKCSKGKDFFGGENIGYIDIALGSRLKWIKAVEIISETKLLDEAKIPQLVKWAERFCSHAVVKDMLPDFNELVEFNKVIVARFKAAEAIP